MVSGQEKRIVVVGGGFAGVRAALDLAAASLKAVKIILVADKPHFEYSPALYRVVTGRSPLEVCVPLQDIFGGTCVQVVRDTITEARLGENVVIGSSGSSYRYDYLVLALGSESSYFGIPGLADFSFSFKSISEALRLKRHLHESFAACKASLNAGNVCTANIVIVGGGASGVEAAGELAVYTRELAEKHHLDPGIINIDLIEAAPHLLPALPADIGARAAERLRYLGVNIFLNQTVLKEEVYGVYLKDMEIKTKTLIWTAGVKPNHLYAEIKGLEMDKRGRVIVDEFLRTKSYENVFVAGDAASTVYAGMAQTALHDGSFIACAIAKKVRGEGLRAYIPHKPAYAIPVGPGWAAVLLGPMRVFGFLAWVLRRFADLRFFFSVLPFRKAILAWRPDSRLCESCPVCMEGAEQAA